MAKDYLYPTGRVFPTYFSVVGAATSALAIDDPAGSPDDGATYAKLQDSINALQDFTEQYTLTDCNFTAAEGEVNWIRLHYRGETCAAFGGEQRPTPGSLSFPYQGQMVATVGASVLLEVNSRPVACAANDHLPTGRAEGVLQLIAGNIACVDIT